MIRSSLIRSSLLVVDDERFVGDFVATALGEKHDVTVCRTAGEGIARLEAAEYPLALVDLQLPDQSGIDFLRRAREVAPETAVIMMTAYNTLPTAVEALKCGAVNCIQKPFDADTLGHQVGRVLEFIQLRRENENLHHQLEDRYGPSRIIGRSTVMRNVVETVGMAARSRANVLVLGENGTGKELIARALHLLSDRHRGPFVKVNCAAIPAALLESELFANHQGAFTGGFRSTPGRFSLAHRGTLLLDQVNEISPHVQARLLRVLQEQEFERVGADKAVRADVRIVGSTSRNLAEMVARGEFRRDLYLRLNVVPVTLPPLRERPGDIPLLVEHFLNRHGRENQLPRRTVEPAAMSELLKHSWPGNVRELENVLERALIMVPGEEIRAEHLRFDDEGPAPAGLGVGMKLRDAERRLILDTLRAHRGNRTRASRVLGISVRTMRNKLNEYRRLGIFHEETPAAQSQPI